MVVNNVENKSLQDLFFYQYSMEKKRTILIDNLINIVPIDRKFP